MSTLTSTCRLLFRVQKGLASPDEQVVSCANTMLSFLVLHLRDEFVTVPDHLEPAHKLLPKEG